MCYLNMKNADIKAIFRVLKFFKVKDLNNLNVVRILKKKELDGSTKRWINWSKVNRLVSRMSKKS